MPSPKVTALFHEALGKAPAERTALLKAVPDPQLRQEVISLLDAHEKGGDILQTRELDGAARLLTVARPLPELAPGSTLGDFLIHHLLGEGAFARVYLATEQSLGRQVALKVSPLVGDEARTMASLDHPHIVKILSEHCFPEQRIRAICMPYLQGMTLRQRLEESTLSIERILEIGLELCAALSYAHRANVLHLDIKPDNIFIDDKGRALLLDFNVSRRDGGSALRGGTLQYMPPEQARLFQGEQVALDARADIFALGKLLMEAADRGGRMPRELQAVLDKCTQAAPEARYASAPELAEALERCLCGLRLDFCLREPTWFSVAAKAAMVAGCFVPPAFALLAAWQFWTVATENAVPLSARLRILYPSLFALTASFVGALAVPFLRESTRRWLRFPLLLGLVQTLATLLATGVMIHSQVQGRFLPGSVFGPLLTASVNAWVIATNVVLILSEVACWRWRYPRYQRNPEAAAIELGELKRDVFRAQLVMTLLPLIAGVICLLPVVGSRRYPLIGVLCFSFAGVAGLTAFVTNKLLSSVLSAFQSARPVRS